jgi:HlyD family secretion protein
MRVPISRESGVASVAILVAISALAISTRSGPIDTAPTARVERRDFVDSILEPGTISTQQVRLYGSEITGMPAKLLSIVPEGTTVAPGDELARFDVTAMSAIRDRAAAELQQAEAEIERARAETEIDSLRAATDIDAARLTADTATRALINQKQGKAVVDAAAAEAAVNDAARELASATTTSADMAQLLKEGFVTRVEMDRADQALRRAEDQHRLAIARRDALVKFDAPAGALRAEADAKTAAANVARSQAAVAARARQREAELAAALSRRDQLRLNIAALSAQISRATIRAEIAGMVLYREQFFGPEKRKPQIGDDINAGQPIIAIPDVAAVTVETSVREVDLHRISTNGRVTVRLDAYPDLSLDGTVSFIGALAQTDASRAGAKFFPVTVALSGRDTRLRSGMSARVEIHTTSLPAALVVPVVAVFDDAGGRHVFVAGARGPERRSVVLAAENASFAALAGGVSEGERVLLTAPAGPVK